MHKFTKKHRLTLVITEEMLHSQITAAIEGGGSRYWAEVDVHKHQKHYANYFTASFKVIEVSDVEHGAIEGKSYKLSIRKLMRGLLFLANNHPAYFVDILESRGDKFTGDALVQAALFGYLVYG